MHEETRSWVELLALQLAGLVVATHLYWGLDRFAEQLRYGVYVDPRPVLFVLSSAAIIAGAAYVALGGRRKPVYALGIALMLVYLFGYWGWHLMGHLPALPWVDDQSHPHPGWGPFETLYRHLAADHLALVSKLAEATLALVLGALWLDERTAAEDGAALADETNSEADAP
ncbi:hypothetical protein L593_08550 [Salinarchaeum sp. Harcht-Bsk1]|uniref:hypothetical protein n=1 Tax=Salinarchaeum sp. Harcht-Bsk1 TaxID=1333523 RepID=UPI000342300D|nr:hypothetical protein [Salinarchaeum sp. Harcht-Bsk1]AGN01655.1 hypothetical protein L593_08550 [Salinarchaeum sp. Harcht-Bsk1]